MSAITRLHEQNIKASMTKEAIPGQQLLSNGLSKGLGWAGKKLMGSGEAAAKQWGGNLMGAGSNRMGVGKWMMDTASKLNPPRGIANFKRVGTVGSDVSKLNPQPGFDSAFAQHMSGFDGAAARRAARPIPTGVPSPANQAGNNFNAAFAQHMSGFDDVAARHAARAGQIPSAPAPSGPTGGFGGMVRGMRNSPWLTAAGAGGAGMLLGNQQGQGTGYQDAMRQHQQNTSGFGGTMKELGHALGIVPGENLFQPKYASLRKFTKAAGASNIEVEQFAKQALMQGAKAVGKSVLGHLGGQWGKAMQGIGGTLTRGAEGAAGAAAPAVGAGWKGTASNWLNTAGQKAQTGGSRWLNEGNKHLNQMNGWGGSVARGARTVGDLAGWAGSPVAAGAAGFGAVDGVFSRKGWTEDGARRGVAESALAMENMNPMQRLAFLFAPGTVAGKGLQRAEQVLPGVSEEYNKLRGGY